MASSFGIKVSQDGKDVRSSGDNELLFSSSWPLLKIRQQGFVPPTDDDTPIYVDHDLGYPSAFLVFDLFGDHFSAANRSVLVTPSTSTIGSAVSKNRLKFFSTFDGVPVPENKYYYYLFEINLTENFESPIVDIGTSPTSRGGEFGLKISTENKNLDSSDMRDYSLTSGARSPMVHSVKNGPTFFSDRPSTDYYVSDPVPLPLPYFPVILGYLEDSNGFYTTIGDSGAELAAYITGFLNTNVQDRTIEVLYGAGSETAPVGRNFSLVFLKDPFEVGELEEIIT